MRAYGVLTMHRNGFHGIPMVETPRRGVSTALRCIDAARWNRRGAMAAMHRNGFHGMRMGETPRRGVSPALRCIDAMEPVQQRRQCTAMVSMAFPW
jgi:hypothetical protein